MRRVKKATKKVEDEAVKTEVLDEGYATKSSTPPPPPPAKRVKTQKDPPTRVTLRALSHRQILHQVFYCLRTKGCRPIPTKIKRHPSSRVCHRT